MSLIKKNTFYPNRKTRANIFNFDNLLNLVNQKKLNINSNFKIYSVEIRILKHMFLTENEINLINKKCLKSFKILNIKLSQLDIFLKINKNTNIYKRGILNRMGKGIGKFSHTAYNIYNNQLLYVYNFINSSNKDITLDIKKILGNVFKNDSRIYIKINKLNPNNLISQFKN